MREHGRRLLRLDQRLVQPAGRRVAEHLGQHFERRRSPDASPTACGGAAADDLDVADAAHGHLALAVLRRLVGVDRRQRARGLGDRAEGLRDERQRLRARRTSRRPSAPRCRAGSSMR